MILSFYDRRRDYPGVGRRCNQADDFHDFPQTGDRGVGHVKQVPVEDLETLSDEQTVRLAQVKPIDNRRRIAMLDQRTIRSQRARDSFRLIAENEDTPRIGLGIEKPRLPWLRPATS